EDSKILTHLVFCWLKDPGNLEHRKKIIEVTDSFNEIPSVINARAGNPIMSDRSIVDDSFDVGIIVEVRDEKGLKEYLGHPIHQKAKKDTLLPLVDRILVYDFTK
ncbi:MAG: Dabb family protein, partial [Opitutae bacterium]|nr:Dabb family protein [Opitutae bacterium]